METTLRSEYEISAIRWYAKKHQYSVMPISKTRTSENLVYFRTAAKRIYVSHIDNILEEYEALYQGSAA